MRQWNVWCKRCKQAFITKTDQGSVECPRCSKTIELPTVVAGAFTSSGDSTVVLDISEES